MKFGLSGFVMGLSLFWSCPGVVLANNQGSLGADSVGQRFALIVGIDDYQDPSVPDLQGAVRDAKRMRETLIHLYSFPEEHVRLLTNEAATLDAFLQEFENFLINRVRHGDTVAIYFSGHGSKVPDLNELPSSGKNPRTYRQIEHDKYDETLCFYDAVTDLKEFAKGHLLDDHFNLLLEALYQKTKDITVILDACFSGTATRGSRVKFFPTISSSTRTLPLSRRNGNPNIDIAIDRDFSAEEFPQVVFMAAAGEGQEALETESGGVFTQALLSALGHVEPTTLTFQRLVDYIKPQFTDPNGQTPVFEGPLRKAVFSLSNRRRPRSWKVTHVTKKALSLEGPILEGMSPGAEVYIYPPDASWEALYAPAKAKARAIVNSFGGLTAKAKIEQKTLKAAIKVNDLAILARPGDDQLVIKVRMRPDSETHGIHSELKNMLLAVHQDHLEAKMLVAMVASDQAFDFELGQNDQGEVVIWDHHGRRRFAIAAPDLEPLYQIMDRLWKLARIRAILKLRGSGHPQLLNNQTLSIGRDIEPSEKAVPMSYSKSDGKKPTMGTLLSRLVCHRHALKKSAGSSFCWWPRDVRRWHHYPPAW